MKTNGPSLVPCLWFDNQAEEAVNFYCSVIKNSKVLSLSRYGKEGQEVHHMPEGTVMTVEFELDGQLFTALNGGPVFKFNEAVSFQVFCDTQEEVDRYWEKLTAGGDESAQACGWLKDRYGLSWQIIPRGMNDLIGGPDAAGAARAMQAMLKMKKLDLAKLKQAYNGTSE